jgi:DNA-binding response OmpR family regulator
VTSSVLVIEDDRDIGELLRRALEGAGIASEVVETGGEGVAAANRTSPDAILLDLDLPDGDGLDLIAELSGIAPVIVITGRRNDDSVVTGLERGADDYVTKPFSPRVLMARIDVAIRRTRGDARSLIEHAGLSIDIGRRAVTLDGVAIDLTRRELDLLAHLADRPGTVVTREELLGAVWQSSAAWQGASTVTEHVRRIRVKLGDASWIESVRGIGYRFVVPDA